MRITLAGSSRRIILVVLGLVWLVPTYLILINAFRPSDAYDPSDAVKPSGSFAFFDNLSEVWQRTDLEQGLVSSLLYSAVSPVVAVLIGALAGYAIVVLRLRHGFFWFMLIYGASALPFQMLLVPLFVGLSNTVLYDARSGMILVYTAINVPFAALVMRNYFGSIAISVYEAARLDGASTLGVFWRIFLPLSWPALAAVFILEFTFVWNDLLFGLTLTQSESVRPVMTELASLTTDAYAGTPIPVALTAGVVVSLPTVVLFLVTQRMFARGLSLSQL